MGTLGVTDNLQKYAGRQKDRRTKKRPKTTKDHHLHDEYCFTFRRFQNDVRHSEKFHFFPNSLIGIVSLRTAKSNCATLLVCGSFNRKSTVRKCNNPKPLFLLNQRYPPPLRRRRCSPATWPPTAMPPRSSRRRWAGRAGLQMPAGRVVNAPPPPAWG